MICLSLSKLFFKSKRVGFIKYEPDIIVPAQLNKHKKRRKRMLKFRRALYIKQSGGFTLIELIVCIVIIGLILLGIEMSTSKALTSNNKRQAQIKTDDGKIYRPLVKIPEQGVLFGVCAGIGYKLGIDPIIPRIIFLVALFGFGSGVLVYVLCVIFLKSANTPPDYFSRISWP